MKMLTQEIERAIPGIRTHEGKAPQEMKIVVKFFDPTGSWTWYVIEGKKLENGDWEFFGLVRGHEAELGYFLLSELVGAKQGLTGLRGLPIERDMHFGMEHTLAEAMRGQI